MILRKPLALKEIAIPRRLRREKCFVVGFERWIIRAILLGLHQGKLGNVLVPGVLL